ncbi:uncharacterized protein LOC119789498 isoform X3 [Cyprinodon tularosa]|uniref:uncharacterized protein LOC119789498 isoform X3 n=1 Tax=Cyprinodon tularosa TaxID=77115 RepID=UPI0018E24063|nr:uncharacterized protein LOC119789498 isoform X3 [Cyprinodon tularosa]
MEFALYYFKDKTVEVGKTSWISPIDQQQCPKIITECPNLEDEDGWMEVKWDVKGRKKSNGQTFFPAKVLMFDDNYSDLCKKRQKFINGEDIWQEAPKRKSKPNSKWKDFEEEDHEGQTKKENEESNRPRKRLSKPNDRGAEEEVGQKNKFRELPAVVTQLKDVVERITNQQPLSTTSVEPPVSLPISPQVVPDHNDMVPLLPGYDVKVPSQKLKSVRTTSSALYIGDLAVLVYGRETLANSSLTGRQSGAHKNVESKPQLDNTKLDAILAYAQAKFPDTAMQDVRRIIRKKCNNLSY